MPSAIRHASNPGIWLLDGFKDVRDYSADAMKRIISGQNFQTMVYKPETLAHLRTALSLLKGRDVRVYLRAPFGGCGRRQAELAKWWADVASLTRGKAVSFVDLTEDHPFQAFDGTHGSTAAWLDRLHFKPKVGQWILGRLDLRTSSD
jgi:hypothetical protein